MEQGILSAKQIPNKFCVNCDCCHHWTSMQVDDCDIAGPSRPPRWSTIRHRFSQVAPREPLSTPSDEVDDELWDKNDTAFLQEVSQSHSIDPVPAPSELTPSSSSGSSLFQSQPEAQSQLYSVPHTSGLNDGDDTLTTEACPGLDSEHKAGTLQAAMDHVRESEAESSSGGGNPMSLTANATILSNIPTARQDLASGLGGSKTPRKHTRNRSSLVLGLRKLMGKRELDQKSAKDMVISAPIRSFHTTSDAYIDTTGSQAETPYSERSAPPLTHPVSSSSTPVSLSESQQIDTAFHRSASVDLPDTLPSSLMSDLVDRVPQDATGQSKHTSIDGLPPSSSRTFAHRFHSTSSRPRRSTIEHTSFDEARKASFAIGSYYLADIRDVRADARSIPSPLRREFEAMSLSHYSNEGSADSRPTRPARPLLGSDPGSSQAPSPRSPTLPTSSSLAASSWCNPAGTQTQFHRPFPKQSQSHHRQPLSQPSSPIRAGFDRVANLSDAPKCYESLSRVTPYSQPANSPAIRRSLGGMQSSKPWSNLFGSSSSTASSVSNHKRLSTATISRPLSVSSSTLSSHEAFGANAQDRASYDDVSQSERWQSEPKWSNLIGPRNSRSSFSTNSALSIPADHASFPTHRTAPRLQVYTDRSAGRETTVKGRSYSMFGADSLAGAGPTFLSQDPFMYRSGSSQTSSSSSYTRSSGLGHRSTNSVSSVSGHRKRPSFGLTISPDAHRAFDSIPSPTIRSRHASSSLEGHYAAKSASLDLSRHQGCLQSGSSSEHTSGLGNGAAPLLTAGQSYYSAPASASGSFTPERQRSDAVPLDEGDSPPRPLETWTPQRNHYSIFSPIEETHTSHQRLGQATKDITFGSAAGMVSKVFEHPFDLVKVRLQTQSGEKPARYAGAFDCFKQTYLNEGIRGLYRGLSMPVIGATLENACLFFTYNQIQRGVRWWDGQASSSSALKADAEAPLSIPQLAIAAAGAGSVTSFVLTPIELIKCKMQVQMITQAQHPTAVPSPATPLGPAVVQQVRAISSMADSSKKLDGPLTLARRTIAADGLRGLWLGQTGTLLRETGGSTAWFLAFESCSRYLIAKKKAAWNRTDVTKKDLTSLELIGAGALSGISYNVVLFPADSVKSTMQTEQEMMRGASVPGAKFKGTGFFATFKKIYATRGVRGLYAGCGVTCLRSAPSSAIIFLMYNKLEALADSYGL